MENKDICNARVKDYRFRQQADSISTLSRFRLKTARVYVYISYLDKKTSGWIYLKILGARPFYMPQCK